MAAEASKEAIADAGITANDLCYIINASGTPERAVRSSKIFNIVRYQIMDHYYNVRLD
jgi:3-oxoacyl-[acyl-carrier-protein] synthase III